MRWREPSFLLLGVVLAEIAFGIRPVADRFTWLLENLPVFIAAPFLVFTARRWPLTPLLYRLLAFHALVLMIGGHWTYAEVPAGDWVRDWLGLARNPYDRFGHLVQGFVPAILIRELLLRRDIAVRGFLGAVVIVLSCLGISAGYELVEWQMAVWTGSAADAFLGSQGDPWDTQWDMACCGIGAVSALLAFSRAHDRQLAAVPAWPAAGPSGGG